MFSKFKNIDVVNKLTSLENKLDVLILKTAEGSIKGCCNCKQKEQAVYSELRTYIEDAFNDLANKSVNMNQSLDSFKTVFEIYKNELINNLSYIIDHLAMQQHTDGTCSNYNKITKEVSDVSKITKQMNDKLDGLFYENEVVKHQLQLQEDVNKSLNEVVVLQDKVQQAIDDINSILCTLRK
jgi:hypothetical protein